MRMAMRMFKVLIATLMTIVLVSACATEHPSHMTGGTTYAQVEQRIAGARTRGDHEGLAQFFAQEADAAMQRAEMHRNLTQTYAGPGYGGGHVRATPALEPSRHCEALVRFYEQAAAENLALAKAHRQLAAEATD